MSWHRGTAFPPRCTRSTDVVCWAAGSDRDWDGTRLCVGGQSAGGNLSAAAARLALENGGPDIALQVLHYAPLDLVTPSRDKASTLGRRAIMKPWMSEVFDTAYLPERPSGATAWPRPPGAITPMTSPASRLR